MTFKTLIVLAVFPVAQISCSNIQINLDSAKEWNAEGKRLGVPGQFVVDPKLGVIYKGGRAPQFAIDAELKRNGFDPVDGTIGLNIFGVYKSWEGLEKNTTYMNYRRYYSLTRGAMKFPVTGMHILNSIGRKIGKDFIKGLKKDEDLMRKNDIWLSTFTSNKAFTIYAIITSAMVVLPMTIRWVFDILNKVFDWIFGMKIPEIIGPNDTDFQNIDRGVLSRIKRSLFGTRSPRNMPKVVVDSALEKKLNSIIESNRKVGKEGRGAYQNLLLYGPGGTGKTLFAKTLAGAAGIRYIYFTLSDLDQLERNKAVEKFKDLIRFAKSEGPCVLIIDEADYMCNGSILAKSIMGIFQREISGSSSPEIQVVFCTNYPQNIYPEIRSRFHRALFFKTPDFETQKRLFLEHLVFTAKISKDRAKELSGSLKKELLEGLTGRSIKSICSQFSLLNSKTLSDLEAAIAVFRSEQSQMLNFNKSEKAEKQTSKKARFK